MADALVVGYGSDLRRDDAAGRHVVRAIAARGLAGVRTLEVHQLTPELAAEIATSRKVVFVDAAVGAETVERRSIDRAAVATGGATHHADPADLLALTRHTHGAAPPAILVTIPAADLGLGEELSPATRRHVAEAIEMVAAEVRAASD